VRTAEPVTQESKTKISRDEAVKWVGEGANKLPKEYDLIPFGDDVDCFFMRSRGNWRGNKSSKKTRARRCSRTLHAFCAGQRRARTNAS
jgi:hypothetical protein